MCIRDRNSIHTNARAQHHLDHFNLKYKNTKIILSLLFWYCLSLQWHCILLCLPFFVGLLITFPFSLGSLVKSWPLIRISGNDVIFVGGVLAIGEFRKFSNTVLSYTILVPAKKQNLYEKIQQQLIYSSHF